MHSVPHPPCVHWTLTVPDDEHALQTGVVLRLYCAVIAETGQKAISEQKRRETMSEFIYSSNV